jgi:RluA family pseudouridine synthase
VARLNAIQLANGISIPILYEDRSVLAIDKPAGWMLVPYNWDKTSRNLQLAISSAVIGGAFWARSRNLKFLKYIHRLDAETTGILLFAKSPGALRSIGDLFETRRMHKRYLAVVRGEPKQNEWICRAPLGPDPKEHGRHLVDPHGKDAETKFRILERKNGLALVEARPVTGRTHQIRLHLAEGNLPIVGDTMYGAPEDQSRRDALMALRAVEIEYQDPFLRKRVHITAPTDEFIQQFLSVDPEGSPRTKSTVQNKRATPGQR